MMDPQQILHLIHFNSSCSEEEESHTLKALLKIIFQYAKALVAFQTSKLAELCAK